MPDTPHRLSPTPACRGSRRAPPRPREDGARYRCSRARPPRPPAAARRAGRSAAYCAAWRGLRLRRALPGDARSEEHTSELQSHVNLVCRLLLEKKKKKKIILTVTKKKKTNQIK